MSGLDKKSVSLDELTGIVSESMRGKARLEQLTWTIRRSENLSRGENFDIEIQDDPSNIPDAVLEARETFSKIKGTFWLK